MRGTEPESEDANRDLYVAFEIKPVVESDCPLDELGAGDDDVVEVRQQLLHNQCHTETTVQADSPPASSECGTANVVHSAIEVDESCYCVIFGEFGCIPEIVGVNDGTIFVETYLPDRERLSDLVEALKAATNELNLRQLRRIDTESTDSGEETVTLVLDEVTEKQREAVTKAVAAGYYSTPRETSLEELADELGISKSACSQRLNAVESTLATRAFTDVVTNR